MDDTISRQQAIATAVSAAIDWHRLANPQYSIAYSIGEAMRALPSAQPEQTDCEYCHEDSDGYVRSIEKNSHAWLVRRGRTMKLRVGFNGRHSECDILFCPMCGRRLTDG